ncbi:MAG: ABC transporter ATP-binding protein [Nanoarchaeota archaeon]
MDTVVVRVSNLSKSFGPKIVLQNVNMEIYSGEILGLIGMSGHGKTTFLNTLIGFLRPEIGDVSFKLEHLLDYENATDQFRSVYYSHDEAKRIFGFAAQNPSFYSDLTVEENLDYFGALYNLSKDIRRTNTKILLNLIGIYSSRNVKARNLSGGMQKRLDIACALIHDPKILILDEPTADLDPVLRKQMWNIIKKINEKGTTILMASHFLDEVESFCDRIAVLRRGEMIHVGTPDQLKDNVSKNEEIILQTYPGNYPYLIRHLGGRKLGIEKIYNDGHKVVIYTRKAELVLHRILNIIDHSKETLVEVNVKKPSLDEVFEEFYKQGRKDEQEDEKSDADEEKPASPKKKTTKKTTRRKK